MFPDYKPLDRSSNEIRLLRIFPPEILDISDTFELSTEPIKCELEHTSLDRLYGIRAQQSSQMADYILGPEIQGGRRQVAHARLMGRLVPERNEQEWINAARQWRMESILDGWHARLKSYLPPGMDEPRPEFELWSKRWIWQALSGNPFPDTHRDGYFALSYVWGSPDVQREIEVNGEVVNVGENLYKALQVLREIPEVRMGTPVWVDALCINQQDADERTFEVKRMADIYAKSQRVISYLGEEENLEDDAVDFLHYLSLKDDEALERIGEWWLLNTTLMSAEPNAAIDRFMSRTYWSRAWILQEIFLAPPGSVIILGKRKIHTRNLMQSARIFELLGAAKKEEIWLRGKAQTHSAVRSLETGFWKLFRLKKLFLESLDVAEDGRPILLGGRLLSILKVLHQNAGNTNCFDERDKIYGQLAMIDRRISNLCTVSYDSNHTFLRTMADFASAVIRGTNRLDWIHCTWAVVLEEDEWPSWVPDFRIGKDGHQYRWASQQLEDASRCNADVEIDAESLVIKCKGYRCDAVISITQSLSDVALRADGRSPDEVYQFAVARSKDPNVPAYLDAASTPAQIRKKLKHIALVDNLKDFATPETHPYDDDESLMLALRKCLERIGWFVPGINIMDIPWELNGEIDFSEISIYDGERQKIMLEKFRELNQDFDLFGVSFKHYFPELDEENKEEEMERLNNFMDNMQWGDKVLSVGRLVILKGGRLAASICDLIPGDVVVVLEGSKLPVVLRAFGPRWRLVGPIYVHGIMNGEAVADKSRAELFEIY